MFEEFRFIYFLLGNKIDTSFFLKRDSRKSLIAAMTPKANTAIFKDVFSHTGQDEMKVTI